MAAPIIDTFEEWLSNRLQALNADSEVFGSYMTGILEGDEEYNEKLEALEGILEQISESEIKALSKEIVDKWLEFQNLKSVVPQPPDKLDLDTQLANLLEQQSKMVITGRQRNAGDEKYKSAILNQYSQVSDDEDDGDKGGPVGATGGSSSDPSLMKNTNSEEVNKAEKDRRSKAKADSEKKKQQDKLNREKVKQEAQERKEKEKKRTQKSEKRR